MALVVIATAMVQPAAASAAAPEVTLAPAAGPRGSTATLSGDGFRSRARVVLRAGPRRLGVVRASRDGVFTASVRIPARATGMLSLTSRARAQRVTNRFEVTRAAGAIWTHEVAGSSGARVRWSPSRLVAPGELLVEGSGFAPRATATIALQGDAYRLRTTRRGRFRVRVPVAPGLGIVAEGTVSAAGVRLPFSVEIEPAQAHPGAPPGLAPADELPSLDTAPPDTTITSGPDGLTRRTEASFTFAADEQSGFECRLDDAAFAACVSPTTVDHLPDGNHVFEARAVDRAGNRDETPARHRWTVDATPPPAPTIALGPGGDTGRDGGDGVTRDSTLGLVGGAEPGAVVRVEAMPSLGAPGAGLPTLVGTAVSSSSGLWSVEGAALDDGRWRLRAVVTDAAGNESPVGELVVLVDTVPPTAPLLTAPNEGEAVPSRSVHVRGMAEVDATVTVADAEGAGAEARAAADGAFGLTIVLEEGARVLVARARDAAGNESAASAGRSLIVDTVAPDTVLGGAPGALTNRTDAAFDLDAGEAGAVYECRLDDTEFTACDSPARLEDLADGNHVFEARAVDRAGNRDETPARHSWTVDATPPAAPIVEAPSDGAAQSAADLRFTGIAEPDATVELLRTGDLLDSVRADATTGAWGLTLSAVADGEHAFTVRAVDEAGNASAESHAIRVRVDATPPETSITGQPAQRTRVATAQFQFTASETGSEFECRLDAQAFARCQSGHTLTGLADGEHTFEVRASDALGNQDPTPATHTWTVDTRPPSVVITAPPDGAQITADGPLNVTAVADDAGTGVAEVRFYDNGVRVVTDTTAPFLYRWTVSAAKAGAHRWTAKAVDHALNAADAAPVDVDVNLVAASAETEPVPTSGDAADDPAIYVHPTDPASSAVIATDKLGGLAVYDLDGRQLHYYDDTLPNNADLRHGIELGGTSGAVVATSDRSDDSLRLYRVDPATRGLADVAARRVAAGDDLYGVCLYRSPATGALYAFTTYDDGTVRQWAVQPDGAGRLDAALAREFRVPVPPAQDGQTTEACVADDDLGRLYVSAENDAIFRFDAEPGAPVAPVSVDVTGAGGHLTADVEGLALFRTTAGDGYLLASSQGSSEFVVYGRQGSNPYITTFGIGAGSGDVDKAAASDGIDATAAALGVAFPQGLFVAHDGFNPLADGTHRQNFKLVPWERIAGSMRVKLTSDPLWTPWPAG